METLLRDLRIGFRALVKKPGFMVVAVITLALGIGANTVIFSVVSAVLLKPLPYQNPDQLLWVTEIFPDTNNEMLLGADFIEVQNQNQVFQQIAAYDTKKYTLTGKDEPLRIQAAQVSANFLLTLGVPPSLGRGFTEEEGKPGNNQVAILNHALWRRQFGSDPQVVGKTLTLNGQSYTVVGVMSSNFQFPEQLEIDALIPLALDAEQQLKRENMTLLRAIARLKPGVTLERASMELNLIARRLEQQFPQEYRGMQIRLVSLHENLVGNVRVTILILLVAVGFVLLIACANVANLMLARAVSRQKEVALRAALGASPWRLVQQLLVESVLLALIGGGVGLLLAFWSIGPLVRMSPVDISHIKGIGINGQVLVFTLVVSVLTGVIFGLMPALAASKPDLNKILKEGGARVAGGLVHRRSRHLLVVVELALALVLLIGAGLLMKSFVRLWKVDPGFHSQNVLAIQIEPPRYRYTKASQRAAFFQQMLQNIRSLPNVQYAGASNSVPLFPLEMQGPFSIQGQPNSSPDKVNIAVWSAVSPDYYRTMGIVLLKGRDFTEQDTQNTPGVAIINQSLARRFFPTEDPIGRQIRLGGDAPDALVLSIVGVIGDVKHGGLDAEVMPEICIPYLQYPYLGSMRVVVQTASDPMSFVAAIRTQVLAVDKDQPISNISTIEQRLSMSVAPRRFNLLMLGVFALAALVLAAVGVYGVISYTVDQRMHEIGIRLAMGARHRHILQLIMGQGMGLALISVVLGLFGASAMTRLLSTLLYGISPTDPATFTGVSIFLMAVVAFSSYVPARKALKVNPIEALRRE